MTLQSSPEKDRSNFGSPATKSLHPIVSSCILITPFLLLFLLVVPGYRVNFSYWQGEIFGVISASQGLRHTVYEAISELHPPLYQVVLWVWINVFGTSELATRSLSTLMIMLGMVGIARLRLTLGLVPTALTLFFLVLNPLTVHYAQETRSYGLTLGLACWAMNAWVRGKVPALILWCSLIALTNFFGTILALALFVHIIISRRISVADLLALGAIAVLQIAWLVNQVVFGNIQRITGNSSGRATTHTENFQFAADAAFPHAMPALALLGLGALSVFVAISILTAVWLVLRFLNKRSKQALHWWIAIDAVAVIFAMALGVAAVSHDALVVTKASFISLVAFGALGLGTALSGVFTLRGFKKWVLAPWFLMGLALFMIVTSQELLPKQDARHDWRGSLQIADATSREMDIPHIVYKSGFPPEYFEFYLPPEAKVTFVPELSAQDLPVKFVLSYAQASCDELQKILTEFSRRDGSFNSLNGRYFYGSSPQQCTGAILVRRNE